MQWFQENAARIFIVPRTDLVYVMKQGDEPKTVEFMDRPTYDYKGMSRLEEYAKRRLGFTPVLYDQFDGYTFSKEELAVFGEHSREIMRTAHPLPVPFLRAGFKQDISSEPDSKLVKELEKRFSPRLDKGDETMVYMQCIHPEFDSAGLDAFVNANANAMATAKAYQSPNWEHHFYIRKLLLTIFNREPLHGSDDRDFYTTAAFACVVKYGSYHNFPYTEDECADRLLEMAIALVDPSPRPMEIDFPVNVGIVYRILQTTRIERTHNLKRTPRFKSLYGDAANGRIDKAAHKAVDRIVMFIKDKVIPKCEPETRVGAEGMARSVVVYSVLSTLKDASSFFKTLRVDSNVVELSMKMHMKRIEHNTRAVMERVHYMIADLHAAVGDVYLTLNADMDSEPDNYFDFASVCMHLTGETQKERYNYTASPEFVYGYNFFASVKYALSVWHARVLLPNIHRESPQNMYNEFRATALSIYHPERIAHLMRLIAGIALALVTTTGTATTGTASDGRVATIVETAAVRGLVRRFIAGTDYAVRYALGGCNRATADGLVWSSKSQRLIDTRRLFSRPYRPLTLRRDVAHVVNMNSIGARDVDVTITVSMERDWDYGNVDFRYKWIWTPMNTAYDIIVIDGNKTIAPKEWPISVKITVPLLEGVEGDFSLVFGSNATGWQRTGKCRVDFLKKCLRTDKLFHEHATPSNPPRIKWSLPDPLGSGKMLWYDGVNSSRTANPYISDRLEFVEDCSKASVVDDSLFVKWSGMIHGHPSSVRITPSTVMTREPTSIVYFPVDYILEKRITKRPFVNYMLTKLKAVVLETLEFADLFNKIKDGLHNKLIANYHDEVEMWLSWFARQHPRAIDVMERGFLKFVVDKICSWDFYDDNELNALEAIETFITLTHRVDVVEQAKAPKYDALRKKVLASSHLYVKNAGGPVFIVDEEGNDIKMLFLVLFMQIITESRAYDTLPRDANRFDLMFARMLSVMDKEGHKTEDGEERFLYYNLFVDIYLKFVAVDKQGLKMCLSEFLTCLYADAEWETLNLLKFKNDASLQNNIETIKELYFYVNSLLGIYDDFTFNE